MPVQHGAVNQYARQHDQYKAMLVGHEPHGDRASFEDKWDSMFGLTALPTKYEFTTFFVNGQRKRINVVAICVNMFIPWFMFAAVYNLVSFRFHYEKPEMMWLALTGCVFFVLIIASMAYRNRTVHRTPMWYVFAVASLSIALILGIVCGQINFQYNTLPSYQINNLNTYVNVNPKIENGQQLMDAGKAYFSDTASLDFKKAIGFKSDDMYCVVPITSGTDQLSSYDFWAVGKNCCSGSGDFRCGEFNNPKAKSGMRQLRDDERPFYRLAVQQAQAAYKITANHPLFFYWMQDPLTELQELSERGWRMFLLGIFCFGGVNTLAVGLAVVGFSKLGHYPTF